MPPSMSTGPVFEQCFSLLLNGFWPLFRVLTPFPGPFDPFSGSGRNGGQVVGNNGGEFYPAGTQIPPTKVTVYRPGDF